MIAEHGNAHKILIKILIIYEIDISDFCFSKWAVSFWYRDVHAVTYIMMDVLFHSDMSLQRWFLSCDEENVYRTLIWFENLRIIVFSKKKL